MLKQEEGKRHIGEKFIWGWFHRIKDDAAVKWNTLYGSLDVYMFDDLAGVLFMDYAWLPFWTFGGYNAGITKWKRDTKNYLFVERYKGIKRWVSWCFIHGLCLLAFLDFFLGGCNTVLIFLNTTLIEKGDTKKQMLKNMGNILKMCPFPQYPSTPPSCNTKLVQLTFSSKSHCNSQSETEIQ